VEGQLLQQPSGSGASGVRGTVDRRLEYAVGDLRGDRRQRVDGSERDPERSEYVHVVLLQSSGADTRAASELHTLKLWHSHAESDGYSDGDSHSDSDTNGHSNSYAHADSYCYCDSNSYAHTDSYCYCDSNSYAYADSYGYCDSNCYAYADSYAYVDAYDPTESKPDTKAASDTAASTVGPILNPASPWHCPWARRVITMAPP
jgi:hypothetical protein